MRNKYISFSNCKIYYGRNSFLIQSFSDFYFFLTKSKNEFNITVTFSRKFRSKSEQVLTSNLKRITKEYLIRLRTRMGNKRNEKKQRELLKEKF